MKHIPEIYNNIKDTNLITAMRTVAKVKVPPYIPMYEVLTIRQVADYFEVPERRIRNIVVTHKDLMTMDCSNLTGKEIGLYAIDCRDLGVHYGRAYYFPNGIKVEAAYTMNAVLNARALLVCAAYLCDESRIAREINKVLREPPMSVKSYFKKRANSGSWFEYEPEPVAADINIGHKTAKAVKPDTVPVVAKRRGGYRSKPVNQLSIDGRVLHRYESQREAARQTGVSRQAISMSCRGVLATCGGYRWQFA